MELSKQDAATDSTRELPNLAGREDPDQAKEDFKDFIWEKLPEIAAGLLEAAKKGQVGAARYLLEIIELFPDAGDDEEPEEEPLTKTLLRKLEMAKRQENAGS
ncbi:MAG TPA: hypothetical protein VND65_01970 [Candidatus Binatia bacterium]|nr:hypothetical protein [Candidatus Binatia bacterium]